MFPLLVTLLHYCLPSVLFFPLTLFPVSISYLHHIHFFLNLRVNSPTFLHLHINPSCILQEYAHHPIFSINLLPLSPLSLHLSLLFPRCLYHLFNHLSICTLFLFLQSHLVNLLAEIIQIVCLILPYSLQLHPLLL